MRRVPRVKGTRVSCEHVERYILRERCVVTSEKEVHTGGGEDRVSTLGRLGPKRNTRRTQGVREQTHLREIDDITDSTGDDGHQSRVTGDSRVSSVDTTRRVSRRSSVGSFVSSGVFLSLQRHPSRERLSFPFPSNNRIV